METYTHTNELSHHGVKGQKWGLRRYQNKDGSLTAAGRKRAAKLENDYKSLTGRNLKKKTKSSDKQKDDLYIRKDTKKMSDNELKEKAARLNLENNYINAINNYQNLNPKQVSRGKRFVDKVIKDIVVPASTEVARNQLKKYMNTAINDSMKKSKNKK